MKEKNIKQNAFLYVLYAHVTKQLIKTTVNVFTLVIRFILTGFLVSWWLVFEVLCCVHCFHIPGAWCTCLHIVLLYCLTIWLLLTDNPWCDTWPPVLSFSGSFHVFIPLSCVFPPFTKVCPVEFHVGMQLWIWGTKPIFTETKMARGQTLGITSWHCVSPHCRTQIFLLTCHISQMCFR